MSKTQLENSLQEVQVSYSAEVNFATVARQSPVFAYLYVCVFGGADGWRASSERFKFPVHPRLIPSERAARRSHVYSAPHEHVSPPHTLINFQLMIIALLFREKEKYIAPYMKTIKAENDVDDDGVDLQ